MVFPLIPDTTAIINTYQEVYNYEDANNDYLQLVTSQYWNKPKFLSWLTANLDKLHDITLTTNNLDGSFDIDMAVGVQLDILGEILGVDRKLTFQPSSVSSSILDDDNFRFVLKCRIAQNHWNGTIIGLYTIWGQIFPTNPISIKDNGDMTVDILFVAQSFTDLQKELIQHDYVIPRCQGVLTSISYNGTFSFRTSSLGSGTYILESDTLAGFSNIAETTGGYFGSVTVS
jgi:hypothetical protein